MHMKDYFIREANMISNRPLPKFTDITGLHAWQNEQRARFHKALGIGLYLEAERTPLNLTVTRTIQGDGYRISAISFESLPGLYVAGNLYVPDNLQAPAPAVLYLCGHSSTQKIHYQHHPRTFARLGFVALILDTVQLGEVQGYHHGTYSYGWFHWISKGYTPAAAEVWNAIRALDVLESLSEVDSERLGVTGHSGGGAVAWWLTCADKRVMAMASSCGTGSIASHIREGTLDTHCDCVLPNNPYSLSFTEMYALAVPRPVLIAAPTKDINYNIGSVRAVYRKLRQFYADVGAEDRLSLIEFEGAHGYSSFSRKMIFHWFLRHLSGRHVSMNDAPDLDTAPSIPDSLLEAFQGRLPPNDESTTVQDWFIPVPALVPPADAREVEIEREKLISALSEESFHFQPSEPLPAAKPAVVHEWSDDNGWHKQFTFESEGGWRLTGLLNGMPNAAESYPVVVSLAQTASDSKRPDMLEGLPTSCLKAVLHTRGTGDTAWHPDLTWSLRRSAMMIGRTIMAMRVYDVLRGLEALRAMPEIDGDRIWLAAKGGMCVAALYAALFDRGIAGLLLAESPATLNSPDSLQNEGEPLEIVNCLRHTDLPHTAALLWPMPLYFVKSRPEAYRFTETTYRRLGPPGGTWRIPSITELGRSQAFQV